MQNFTPRFDIPIDYLTEQGLSYSFPKRFWSKVAIKGPDDCWLWTAHTWHGYGQINRGYFPDKPNKIIAAHMASYILCVGPIPKGMFILHKCPTGHNRACVNPAHLKAGTKSENGKDSMLSGTCWFCRRRDAMRSKLTAQLAAEIRSKYTGTRGEQAALGREYGVTRKAIRLIVHGVTW